MLYNVIISGIRTGVAALVGLLITWLINKGIDLGDDFAVSLNIGIFAAVTAGYNALVNWLATRWNKWFGVLLGVPKTPEYERAYKDGVDGIEGEVA